MPIILHRPDDVQSIVRREYAKKRKESFERLQGLIILVSLSQAQSLLETFACLAQAACSIHGVSISVGCHCKVCVSRFSASNLDGVTVVKLLAVLELVVIAHEWTV